MKMQHLPGSLIQQRWCTDSSLYCCFFNLSGREFAAIFSSLSDTLSLVCSGSIIINGLSYLIYHSPKKLHVEDIRHTTILLMWETR
jgi:hypothetical protein